MKRKTIIFITTIMLLTMTGCGNTSGETESNQTSAEMESALSQSQESQPEESQADVNTTPKADSVPKVESKEFSADVNHDGKEDKIILTVDGTDTTMPTLVTVKVLSDEAEIYQDEIPVTYALAYQYYLTEWEGQDYMLCYYPLVDHDMATCRFEVFSLNEAGKKEILDSGEIGASLVTPAELDKSEWLAFAEKENKYFENAYLLADTTDFKIESGDPEQKQGYNETFSWINVGQDVSYDTAEENLQHFMEQESDYD